jgi:hypothetical protein
VLLGAFWRAPVVGAIGNARAVGAASGARYVSWRRSLTRSVTDDSLRSTVA